MNTNSDLTAEGSSVPIIWEIVSNRAPKKTDESKKASREQFLENYRSFKLHVDSLKKAFPGKNKFSRQDIYRENLGDGEFNDIILPASVLIDPSKPDGFVVLDECLGEGTFGRVKAVWYRNEESNFQHEKVRKIIQNKKGALLSAERELYFQRKLGDADNQLQVRDDDVKIYLEGSRRSGSSLFQESKRVCSLTFLQLLKLMRLSHQDLMRIHQAGVIHCDVKTDNLIVDIDEKGDIRSAEYIDFGLAVNVDEPPSYGASSYAHPDVLKEESKAGQWVDSHSEAGLFSTLLLRFAFKDKTAHLKDKTLSEFKIYQTAVNAPYCFEESGFRLSVPPVYKKALLALLMLMEGIGGYQTPSDQQVAACLEILIVCCEPGNIDNNIVVQENIKKLKDCPKLYSKFSELVDSIVAKEKANDSGLGSGSSTPSKTSDSENGSQIVSFCSSVAMFSAEDSLGKEQQLANTGYWFQNRN